MTGPASIDRSTLGHPGKFSYCVAEDEEDTSWLSLSEHRGVPKGASSVTVLAAGAPRQLMNEWTTKPEEILETFAAEMRANMRHYSIHPGNYALDQSQAAARASAGRRLEQGRHRDLHPRARAHPSPRMGRCRQGCRGARSRRQRLSGDGFARPAAGRGGRRAGRRLRRRHSALARQQELCRHLADRRLRRLRTSQEVIRGNTCSRSRSHAGHRPATGQLAPRLDTLEGKTIGFISNGKEGTKGFFKHLEKILREEYGVATVVSRTKSNYSAPADPHIVAEIKGNGMPSSPASGIEGQLFIVQSARRSYR
jgi:hypothetical protein